MCRDVYLPFFAFLFEYRRSTHLFRVSERGMVFLEHKVFCFFTSACLCQRCESEVDNRAWAIRRLPWMADLLSNSP